VATLSNEAGNAVCCLQYQADQHRVGAGTRRMAVQSKHSLIPLRLKLNDGISCNDANMIL
jgi:hypothetical protein